MTENEMKLTTDGNDIPARVITDTVNVNGFDTTFDIYYPEDKKGPFKIVYYIHGGAYVTGWRNMNEGTCRQIARDLSVAVITPDYVFAPTYQFPTQIEQLYALLEKIVENKDKYELDDSKIAVCGNSAGGNFSPALCVMAKERKTLHFDAMGLLYPQIILDADLVEIDDSVAPPTGEVQTKEQYISFLRDQFLPMYLGDYEKNRKDPRATALYADPECFPATIVFHGRQDGFYFDGQKFVDMLHKCGKQDVAHIVYSGVGHGFLDIAGREDIARKCKDYLCAFLNKYMND